MYPIKVLYSGVILMIVIAPVAVNGQQSIDRFTYIGTGFCQTDGPAHDFLGADTIASPEDCAAACLSFANVHFVGFDHDGQNCKCRFDDGGLPATAPDGWTPYADNSAIGAISSSSGPDSRVCYGYNLDFYSFLGKGYCLGSNGQAHDLVQSTSVPSLQDCATACLSFVNDDFLGFDYGDEAGSKNCKCRFVDGGVPSEIPAGWTSNPSNTGTGGITSTSGTLSRDCFKYMDSLSKYSKIDRYFNFTPASISVDGSAFQFEFTNAIPGSTIHAAVIAKSPCTDANSNDDVKKSSEVGDIIGSTVIDESSALIVNDIESDVTLEDKNSGSVTLQYCLRADLYDTSDPTLSV